MRAGAGDPTVGVALEGIASATGEIKVLISRRNKSLTVEAVESQITQRIADMEIEDEVQILISSAVDNLDLDDEIGQVVDEEIALLDQVLSVEFDSVNNQIINISSNLDNLVLRVGVLENDVVNFEDRINTLESWKDEMLTMASSIIETTT